MDNMIFKSGEAAVFKLRSLYKKYGFRPFKMSKFEEYDLYVRNKDFLPGNGVITFMDTNGDLLALKPDVTLSIIKNTREGECALRKVYYDENVYRISGDTNRFKEIMQTGIECIGDVDAYSVYEVLYLAARSLDAISESFVLDISHMGILKALLDEATDNATLKSRLTELIAEKNRHELSALCTEYGIPDEFYNKLISLASMHGGISEVMDKLAPICTSDAARAAYLELSTITSLLSGCELQDKIRIDFSVVNNMSYYDGIVFKGFLAGLPEGVLAGGQYGALLRSMGMSADAIGFAIYLDMLEDLGYKADVYDVDVLLLYSEKTDISAIIKKAAELTDAGKSVSAQRTAPEQLKYRELIKI